MPSARPGLLREGTDVTLLAYGPMVKTCLQAAQAAEEEAARSRSSTSARCPHSTRRRARVGAQDRPGRRRPRGVDVPRPGCRDLGLVTERAFYHLEAPVLRVGGYNVPYPPSRLEEEFLPDLDRVLDAVDRSLAY